MRNEKIKYTIKKNETKDKNKMKVNVRIRNKIL